MGHSVCGLLTPINLVVKEFLFGNVQIGFKSQGLLYKVSCIKLGTPHETQPNLFYQTKII